MVSSLLQDNYPGVVTEQCITAEAAAKLTGYNIQHIRRLTLAGKLKATRVGRSWLIYVESLEAYLNDVMAESDARFGSPPSCQWVLQNGGGRLAYAQAHSHYLWDQEVRPASWLDCSDFMTFDTVAAHCLALINVDPLAVGWANIDGLRADQAACGDLLEAVGCPAADAPDRKGGRKEVGG
jgi:excisionase family DNA binding protein